jgi:hypothetical protein
LSPILITSVDEAASLGTFQSHNQKVVANANGVFLTYLREDNEADDKKANVWRLARSTDGGSTFATLYEEMSNARAPVLETDEENNICLACPEYGSPVGSRNEFRFYRFLAAVQYKDRLVRTIPGVACAAKYAMAYDSARKQFYVATQYGRLLAIDRDGKLVRNSIVLQQYGPEAATQYPLLFVDAAGTLHHAWTTAGRHTACQYPSIHYLKSPDGGVTWQRMVGAPVATPAIPDRTGPSDVICLADEYSVETWLGAFYIKNGKSHFAYRAGAPLSRQHYTRFDSKTGKRDRDSWADDPRHEWRGNRIVLSGTSGLFASELGRPDSPLYAVQCTPDGHIGCLSSPDNGQTWHDHARSERAFSHVYAIGGCRRVTSGGQVIGSFTARPNPEQPWSVYFFAIPTEQRGRQRE